MADFTQPDTQQPQLGQVQPRTVKDIGTILSLDDAGAGTTLSSTARGNEKNASSRGVRVVVDLTKNSGTIDVVVTIRSYDKGSGKYIDRLSSASLTSTGTTEYIVHPDLTAAANTIAKNFIGEEFDVKVVSGAGTSPNFDATISACLLP